MEALRRLVSKAKEQVQSEGDQRGRITRYSRCTWAAPGSSGGVLGGVPAAPGGAHGGAPGCGLPLGLVYVGVSLFQPLVFCEVGLYHLPGGGSDRLAGLGRGELFLTSMPPLAFGSQQPGLRVRGCPKGGGGPSSRLQVMGRGKRKAAGSCFLDLVGGPSSPISQRSRWEPLS